MAGCLWLTTGTRKLEFANSLKSNTIANLSAKYHLNNPGGGGGGGGGGGAPPPPPHPQNIF